MLSYHDHNEERRVAELLEALTRGDVALVSDGPGMPTLADPGHELLRAALAEGLRVEVLPGPDALTTALVGSGLPSDSFIWLGFLPVKARRAYAVAGEPASRAAHLAGLREPATAAGDAGRHSRRAGRAAAGRGARTEQAARGIPARHRQ